MKIREDKKEEFTRFQNGYFNPQRIGNGSIHTYSESEIATLVEIANRVEDVIEQAFPNRLGQITQEEFETVAPQVIYKVMKEINLMYVPFGYISKALDYFWYYGCMYIKAVKEAYHISIRCCSVGTIDFSTPFTHSTSDPFELEVVKCVLRYIASTMPNPKDTWFEWCDKKCVTNDTIQAELKKIAAKHSCTMECCTKVEDKVLHTLCDPSFGTMSYRHFLYEVLELGTDSYSELFSYYGMLQDLMFLSSVAHHNKACGPC